MKKKIEEGKNRKKIQDYNERTQGLLSCLSSVN